MIDVQARPVVVTAATLCLVALAGCGQPAGSLSMDPVNDTELADKASTNVSEEDLAATEDRDHGVRILRQAVKNDSATVAATEPPHSANETVYQTGDRFYTLSYTVVNTTTGRQVTYRLDKNVTANETDHNRLTVADYDDLPPVDQSMLHSTVSYLSRDSLEEDEVRPGGVEKEQTYSSAELNRSAIAGGQYDAIRYEETLIQLEVVSNESQSLTVYRYRPVPVANGVGPYSACLRDTYGFELNGLDSDTRAVVTEATDGTYRAENTSDVGFRSVLDRFHEHTAVSATDQSGSWLVRYDGQLYWANLRYDAFDEYDQMATADQPAVTCSG
ncbi:hypothetical protein ACODNH_21550 (plasmid) [Haloarcula sp. NS06]|uniref:hypothetical protein n=1 Tax=Haloarcula sp. NS06 TaxID=3409688 RepID=UPI003DA780D6